MLQYLLFVKLLSVFFLLIKHVGKIVYKHIFI